MLEYLKFTFLVPFIEWNNAWLLVIADIFIDLHYGVVLDESKIKSDFFFYSFDVAVVFDTSF